MGDIFKRFRRQKSLKNSVDETAINHLNEISVRSNDVNKNADASTSSRSMSVCSETANCSVSNSQEIFKEPKGWRKSLRKLRIKKRQPSISASSENLVKTPMQVTVVENKVGMEAAVSKRWSYSPDLCEENVPGAKELRGTIEKKLSIKQEVDETSCINKYRQDGQQTVHGDGQLLCNEQFDYTEQSDVTTPNTSLPISPSGGLPYETPLDDNQLNNSNLSTFQSCEMSYNLEQSCASQLANESSYIYNAESVLGPKDWTKRETKDLQVTTDFNTYASKRN